MTQRLSQHFTLAEMTRSNTAARKGIPNVAPPEIQHQLFLTADRMERVRSILGDRPIRISSGYRSPAVNRAVGGSRTSAHMTGFAVDFTCPDFGSPGDIVRELMKHRDRLGPFDQVIEEFGEWVHIGFGPGARRQVLVARKVSGRTVYTDWKG